MKCFQRPLLSLLPLLALGALAWAGSTPALAQPPDPGTEMVAYSVPEIETAWDKLRQTVGTQEFTDPVAAIARYQKFYEAQGFRSAQTAIKITSAIAQLYWQQLDDRAKALAIYDWAIPQYGALPRGERLQQERDLVAASDSFRRAVAVFPVRMRAEEFKIGIADAALAPVAVAIPKIAPAPKFAPLAFAAAPFATAPKPAPVAPVKLPSPNGAELARPVPAVSVPASSPSPVKINIAPPPLASPAPVVLPPVNEKASDGKPLAVAPPASQGATFVAPPSVHMASAAPSLIAPHQFSARVAAVAGLVTQWRAGQLLWEDLLAQTHLTPADALELLASPAIITNYSDAPLRARLMAIVQQSPELLKDRATLAPPVQIALAESYGRAHGSEGEAIYRKLLKSKIPDGVWWHRLVVMTLLSDYYAAMGDLEKAAQTKLEIVQVATDKSWQANATVEAARYYMQIGEEKTAQTLREDVTRYGYGWATGLAIHDQAGVLIVQGKHEEARKLLNTPITGRFAEQIKVAILSRLARSYYLTGELETAKKISGEAVALINSIELLKGEGMEGPVSVAYTVLEWSTLWAKQPIISEPQEVRLMIYPWENKVAVQRLSIRTFKPTPLKVVVNHPDIQVFLSNESRKSDYFAVKELLIEIPPNVVPQSKGVVITVSSAESPNFLLEIPVHIEVQKPITMSPSTVFFGFMQKNTVATQTLTLSAPIPFRVMSVEPDSPELKIGFAAGRLSRDQKIELKLASPQEGQVFSGTIRIKTDVPSQEMVEVKYVGRT